MAKLTKRSVDAAQPALDDYIIWDDALPGFGLRVYPSGKKSYLVQYRHQGRTRRIRIGAHGQWTADNARKRALNLRVEVNAGSDPSAERRALARDLTVAQLCDVYFREGCDHKKASTVKIDRGRVARHIEPLLGRLRVASVSADDVAQFKRDVVSGRTATRVKTGRHGLAIVRGGSGAAARTMGLLGAIMTFARKRKLRPDNPVLEVPRPKDRKRQRLLTDQELSRLAGLLVRAEALRVHPYAVLVVRLLLLTGCRKSEIMGLKWSEVQYDAKALVLADGKTGGRTLPLNEQAYALISDIPRTTSSPFVFPATRGSGHFTDLQRNWVALRRAAGIGDVRIHDLRHSFATLLARGGTSLQMIGDLLGHRDLRTTLVYAHLVDEERRRASQLAGDMLSSKWTT